MDGIVFLHSHGIIHRDLKPHNILTALNHNGVYVPKITDFGISKKLDVNKSSVFTNSLAGAGTLSFASPEQLLGNTIRKNTDLWSFGVIACWIFTGKLPFNSGSLAATSEAGRIELFKQITAGEISDILTQIPSDWRGLVRQCLVVDVDRRVSGAGKCLEILSGKVEVPFENHKSENTGRNTTVTSKAATEAPRTTTNYSSTRTKNSAPKPKSAFVGNRYFDYKSNSKITKKLISYIVLGSLAMIWGFSLLSTKVIEPNNETITDIDGNVYHTVTIGNQTWMIENLKTTRYSNGDFINYVPDENEWNKLTSPANCDANSNANSIGRLYNWYAVVDDRKIAPSGWRVATDVDFSLLAKTLTENGYDYDMSKRKENIFFKNIGQLNNLIISFFTKQIGDDNYSSNIFNFFDSPYGRTVKKFRLFRKPGEINYTGSSGFWSSSQCSNGYSDVLNLDTGCLYLIKTPHLKTDGLCVRCIKNN